MPQLKSRQQGESLARQAPETRPESTRAAALLAGIAALSALLYLLVLTRPFNLLELYPFPELELRKLSQDYPSARWSLVALFLAQGGLYWLGWRLARRTQGRAAWIVVLGGAAVLGASLLFLYPIDAADIFDNIGHGRILGIYGANPFRQVAADFADDPFLPYVAWEHAPSAYGPAWEILAAVTARVAGDGVIANVIAFKLLVGAFWASSVGVATAILRRIAPGRALAGVVWLAWNPVILYETWGNGHNDIVMVFWVLVAAWALLCRRHTWAVLSLLVGALVKFIPLLMLPAAGLIALRELENTRARVRFLAVTGILALALVALAYGPFWHGPETLTIGRRTRLFTTSLPAVATTLLASPLGADQASKATSTVAAGLTFAFALWQGLRAWRNRSQLAFAQATLNILLFYLLLTCLWFQQWYAVWPLAIAALLPPGPAVYLAFITGYSTLLAKHLIIGPMLLWIRPLPPKAWRELRLGPLVLGMSWLYGLYAVWLHGSGRCHER